MAPHFLLSDCMTSPAIVVHPDDPARRAAQLMLAHKISGLPVVDADGRPIGMVSEWDFVTGAGEKRESRRDDWLRMLSEGQSISEDYLTALDRDLGVVRQFMASPAISLDDASPIAEAARLIGERRIQRVPVTRNGRVVGVVTRADVLRVFSGFGVAAPEPAVTMPIARATEPSPIPIPETVAIPAPEVAASLFSSAQALRASVGDFERRRDDERRSAAQSLRSEREALVRQLLNEGLSDAEWAGLASEAKSAAANGLTQCVVQRFPAALCVDGGRAINVPEPDWPQTLRGKPSLFYARWRDELRPLGFRLGARIVTFPDGLPGDVEMTLVWGR
ncbi:MAG: CBS domain-containing protein [Hyphomicrobiales bacterium]|nr:CBS domain-containing protein [Hyphomicrobiales bacterium]